MRNKSVLLALILAFCATSLMAQSRHYNSMSLGMGGGGTAYVGGYHSNFVNPANLMIKTHRQKNTIGIIGGIGVSTGGNLLNISVYNKYLTQGLVIEGETRENMLNDWFGSSSSNVRDMAATVSVVPFGYSHRGTKSAFSVASRFRVTEEFGVSKGVMQLAAYGLDSEIFSTATPFNFNMNTVAFAEISVGYARQVLALPNLLFAKDVKLYAGVAPKYLYGVYTAAMDFNSTLHMRPATATEPFSINHTFDYNLQTIGEISAQLQAFEAAYELDKSAELGNYVDAGDISNDFGGAQATGFGLDLGATLEMDITSVPIPLFINKKKTLRLSMSVTDLGKLNYNQNSASISATGNFDYYGAQDSDNFDTFFDNLADSLQNDVYGNFDSNETDGVVYKLPAMFNFGSSLEMGKLLVALDYGFGFNNNGTNSRRSALNIGAQYKLLGFMPIRVGTRIGGISSTSYSAGFGFDFSVFEFSAGAQIVPNSEKHGASVGAAWSGIVFRF